MMAEKHTMASLNKQQLKRSLLSVRKVRAPILIG
jgi:hypothetical protein